MEILYEDNEIIVINKPAGVATQSANISQKDCVSLIKEHLKKTSPGKKGDPYVGIIHRLDQPVSGILVFAKNQKSAAELSKQVQTDIMNKRYSAKVEGLLETVENRELKNYIYKDPKQNKAIIPGDKSSNGNIKVQEAVLIYSTEGNSDGNSNVGITLKTGRFHQIRAQFAALGHPILGDTKYGAVQSYKKGQIALCARELTFVHPVKKEKMHFELDTD